MTINSPALTDPPPIKHWPWLAVVFALLVVLWSHGSHALGQRPDKLGQGLDNTAGGQLLGKIPLRISSWMSTISVRLRLVAMIVKPRMGVRHGHPVVVNRQLCIANAFEQVLKKKTPFPSLPAS